MERKAPPDPRPWKKARKLLYLRRASCLRPRCQSAMLWFLERASETLVCEVRQADDADEFEFSVRTPGQPEQVERIAEPTALIETLVLRQQQLYKDGWRPKN